MNLAVKLERYPDPGTPSTPSRRRQMVPVRPTVRPVTAAGPTAPATDGVTMAEDDVGPRPSRVLRPTVNHE